MELIEIFEKALIAFKDKEKEFLGMCSAILYVTHPNENTDTISMQSVKPDWLKAHAYLLANKPTPFLHPEFYKLPNYNSDGAYWWTYNPAMGISWNKETGRKIRIQFLEKLIAQLKNEQNETANNI